MPNILALIPARGGSKGLPGKNIRSVLGHPLLAYTVAAAKASRLISRTICSTDNAAIASAARQAGAETPFMRPAELAQDETPDWPVFEHALAWLEKNEKWKADLVVHLRVTTPARPAGIIDQAIQLLLDNPEATAVRSICPAPVNPFKMWRLDQGGPYMRNLLDVPGVPEPFNAPRQLLPQAWWHVGVVDVIRAEVIRAGSMTGGKILPLKIDGAWAIDIDDEEDLRAAEQTMRRLPCILPEAWTDLARIGLLVLDLDGTLTPGTLYYGAEGEMLKRFHVRDGHGMARARRLGLELAVISGENSPSAAARMRASGVTHYFPGVKDKLPIVRDLAARLGLTLAAVAYVGDDELDLPCLRAVDEAGGLACAPADAHPAILAAVARVTQARGGEGAVREVCDLLCAARVAGA
jgi:N-acylneuraminate cytidylyltransferase